MLNCLLHANFLMFYDQSAVEREFNTNAGMVTDSHQSDHSLMALCIVYDHMRSYEVSSHDMGINKEFDRLEESEQSIIKNIWKNKRNRKI